MYLHKDGCKYYESMFENLELKTRETYRTKTSLSAKDCAQSEYLTPIKILQELQTHIINIEKHITSEQSVIKNLVNKMHNAFIQLKKQATDPEFMELSYIAQQLTHINKLFAELSEIIGDSVAETKALINNGGNQTLKADYYINVYGEISRRIINISSQSSTMATKLKNFAIKINLEKELIKEEETAIMDFNKNLMSWF
jgi:hypothetical protein